MKFSLRHLFGFDTPVPPPSPVFSNEYHDDKDYSYPELPKVTEAPPVIMEPKKVQETPKKKTTPRKPQAKKTTPKRTKKS